MTDTEALDPDLATLATLPERMRYAADVLEEVSRRYHAAAPKMNVERIPWQPLNLRYVADQFAAEDEAAAERESHVENLAREISDHLGGMWHTASDEYHVRCRAAARKLVVAGWSKAPAL